jgi:hypothetical protein
MYIVQQYRDIMYITIEIYFTGCKYLRFNILQIILGYTALKMYILDCLRTYLIFLYLFNTAIASSAPLRFHCVGGCWD